MVSKVPPSSSPHPPTTPKRSSRPHGQWKIDGTTPLNHNEEYKQESDPLAVRKRIEQIYAKQGFSSITDDDLHGRFRWWGLYTQRKPGIDGGKTATLKPHELEDEYFMLRVRIDGGALSTQQLRTIADISTTFGRNSADITDRQNIQIHWIEIHSIPEIWRRLESVGLSTTEACGDVPRVILGSPVAGVAKDELLDPTPVIEEIQKRYIGDPELANLPRKFKSAITGHPSLDVVHEINDISFVAVDHPELGIGYDIWVGGALSTAPRLAERLNAFVSAHQAPDVWHGVVRIFRDYGYRRVRNKARLKFLLADWGVEKFREVLESEYLGYQLPDSIEPPAPTDLGFEGRGDHIGIHEQHDGRFYIGAAPTVGRVSGDILAQLADLAEAYGSQRVRLTPQQKLLVLDVSKEQVEPLVGGLATLGLYARPNPFRRHTIACTGIEYCKLAIVETKATSAAAVTQLEERLGDLSTLKPISLHINGCSNSCARIQTADIGLKGQLVTVGTGDDAHTVPGFQVHLGGGLTSADQNNAGIGRTIRGLKVTADSISDYVERVVRRYNTDHDEGETFAQWAHRADEETLR